MTLTAGSKLGPYEIQSPLGSGGMGEVYRARDTRLERTVAIKILPPQFSADPVSKQRFEREAKTISSLNHPHICAQTIRCRMPKRPVRRVLIIVSSEGTASWLRSRSWRSGRGRLCVDATPTAVTAVVKNSRRVASV
jgi:serine/threonine protein kinase